MRKHVSRAVIVRLAALLCGVSTVLSLAPSSALAQAAQCPTYGCVSLTPVVNLGSGYEILNNPSFEQFTTGIAPGQWVRSEAAALVSSRHHCGNSSLAIGRGIWGNGFAYQQVSIPSSASGAYLELWLDVETNIPADVMGEMDDLNIEIHGGTADAWPGPFIRTVQTFSNLDATSGAWFYKTSPSWKLGDLAGQTIQVWIIGTFRSSGRFITNFFVDDVQLWTGPHPISTAC